MTPILQALPLETGLHTIDWSVPKSEIGYWVRTTSTGRGFATETTNVLIAFARMSVRVL